MAKNTTNKSTAKAKTAGKAAEETAADETATASEAEEAAAADEIGAAETPPANDGDGAGDDDAVDGGNEPGDADDDQPGTSSGGTIVRAEKRELTPPIAKVTHFFQRAHNGDTVRADHCVGDLIDGALAIDAVAFGWAKWLSDEELQARVEAAKAAEDENE